MILVTGATGLLGSQVCRELMKKQIPFRALKRSSSLVPPDLSNVQWIDGDISNFESLDDAFEGVDTVIHAAAVVSFYKGDRAEMTAVNVGGTRNVVNQCIGTGSRLIHVSSIAALGKSSTRSSTEDDLWDSTTNGSHYGLTKHQAELEVWRGKEEGLQVVIVNPSVILGRGDWNQGSTQLFKYAWKQRPFYPMGGISYVDNRDVAEIVVLLTTTSHWDEQYILNAGRISFAAFFEKAALAMGRKPPTWQLPGFLLFAAYTLSSIHAFLTRSRPLVTREALRLREKQTDYDASKIKKLLNFAFRDIDDSISWVGEGILKE